MKFNKKLVPLAVLSTLLSAPATAAIVNFDIYTDASVHLHGEIADWRSHNGNTESESSAAIMNLYETPSSVSSIAHGNDSGKFYLSGDALHGGEWFGADSSLEQHVEFQNQTGHTQSYNFSFTIEQGMLALFGALGEGEANSDHHVEASYQASIFLNGQSIWNSHAWLQHNADGLTLVTEGTVLAGALEHSILDNQWEAQAFNWSAQTFQLNLGELVAGESFELSYQVSAYIGGRPNSDSCTNWQCGGHYYFGDPFAFSGAMINDSSFSIANQDTTPVNAPATFGSLLIGLLALRLRRSVRS